MYSAFVEQLRRAVASQPKPSQPPSNCEQFNASLRPRDSQLIVHIFTIILIFQRFFRIRTTLPKIRCWFVTGRSLYLRLSG